MSPEKILLLDYDEGKDLAEGLCAALQPFAREDVKIQHERARFEEHCAGEFDLGDGLVAAHPSVVLLVLSQSRLACAAPLLEACRREWPGAPLAVVTEAAEQASLMSLFKSGMTDFLTPPFSAGEVCARIWRLLQQTRQSTSLTESLKEKLGMRQLVGESTAFLAEVKRIPLIAKCDAGVLITGETGTGKEVCARAIHYLSPRAHKPFVPVNCGAIALELVENELFGHKRGAFTGAFTSQVGLIEMADTGTLFLDEIDCLPPNAQVKLLRFLQEKEYRTLGSAKVSRADVRVIAATNADLSEAVKTGKLRRDLFYRLNVIPLRLPPLRERRDDIPILALHFLNKYSAKFDKPGLQFSPAALRALALHDWPGNVRELENTVEREVALAEGASITLQDSDLPCDPKPSCRTTFQQAKAEMVAQFERTYLDELLRTYQGNITKAAQAANKNRRTLWQLIRKHGINVKRFRLSHSSE
ncbi:MAG TPA: sigma-54 dependent transcriptional regulator [Pyrinomonadaceae bacterium]|nr:sigma-54 dependent transcriptional regulator [Pyrinomonadaceae bacterium]